MNVFGVLRDVLKLVQEALYKLCRREVGCCACFINFVDENPMLIAQEEARQSGWRAQKVCCSRTSYRKYKRSVDAFYKESEMLIS